MNLKAAAGALILHVAVLFPWGCTDTTQPKETQQKPVSEVLEVSSKFIPMSTDGEGECPGYKGIGVVSFGILLDVAPGGPADQAGLKIGETIVNEEVLGRDRYEIGHFLRLTVQDKDGRVRQVLVVTAWICEMHSNPLE